MTRPRRTERTWGNVAALCAKPAEVCAFGRFTSRSSHRCYSRRARRNREIIFAAPSRARPREGTTHTLENMRICERKGRRITYVVKKNVFRAYKRDYRSIPRFLQRSHYVRRHLANGEHKTLPGRPKPIRRASEHPNLRTFANGSRTQKKTGKPRPEGQDSPVIHSVST